jgi:hypothetical protein
MARSYWRSVQLGEVSRRGAVLGAISLGGDIRSSSVPWRGSIDPLRSCDRRYRSRAWRAPTGVRSSLARPPVGAFLQVVLLVAWQQQKKASLRWLFGWFFLSFAVLRPLLSLARMARSYAGFILYIAVWSGAEDYDGLAAR